MSDALVQTYRGPRPAQKLGATLMHEHIFVRNPELELSLDFDDWDEGEAVERAVSTLSSLRELGVDTIVDLTVPGLGRDAELVCRVAVQASVNVIAATGWYGGAVLPPYFQFHGPDRLIPGIDPLIQLFVREIEEGIGHTGIRAGMIKVTTSDSGITADEARTLTAAAIASGQTGVAITTHSNATLRTGREQQRFLLSLGVRPERLIIGHSGDTTDVDYLRGLMDEGSTIGFDRFGMEHVLDDESRIATLSRLIALGYADRIVLSHDAAIYSHVTPPSWRAVHAPHWHMESISRRVLPRLHEEFGDAALDTMLIENPRRILSRSVAQS